MGTESTQSPDAVRAQLKKILGSKQFRSSELPRKFLTFVVLKTLENKAAEIKEYAIGVEAFNRGDGFDPRMDSVVRVVARRVRDRLAEYYRQEGKDDSLVIEVPTGSYIPSFSIREASTAAGSPSPGSVEQPDAGINDSLRTPGVENLSTNVPHLNFRTLVSSKWTWAGLLVVLAVFSSIYLAVQSTEPPKVLSYKQLTRDGQGKLDAFAVGTPAPLVTDGSRIYFSEVSGSQVVIKEVSELGGETVPLGAQMKEPLVVMNISPDRSELLATDFFQQSPEKQLFTLPLPGGIPRPLGQLVGRDGAWSPDGTRICYAKGNSLYFAERDGSDSKMIAELPGLPSWPRWSPDGTRLRVTVQDSTGGTSLWEVPLRNAQPRPLFPDWKDHPAECCGSWSPDGKYFVFQSASLGNTELWAVREPRWGLIGSHAAPVRLTEGPLNVWAPVFSTDGRKIFAVVQQRRGELVRYDPTSQSFVLYLNGISADHVEFSPDAQWIAYCAYPEQTI